MRAASLRYGRREAQPKERRRNNNHIKKGNKKIRKGKHHLARRATPVDCGGGAAGDEDHLPLCCVCGAYREADSCGGRGHIAILPWQVNCAMTYRICLGSSPLSHILGGLSLYASRCLTILVVRPRHHGRHRLYRN
jgi:hypothetical protein